MVSTHDVTAILAALGTDPKEAGDRVRAKCPLAPWTHAKGHDATPSFVAFPTTRGGDDVPIYSCSSCHESGRLEDLLLFMWSKGRRVYPLLARLVSSTEKSQPLAPVPPLEAARRRVRCSAKAVPRQGPRRVSKFDVVREASRGLRELHPREIASHPLRQGDEAERYLLGRGFTPETLRMWGIGHDRRRRRVLFPFYDTDGRLVAVSGRLYACPRCGTPGPTERKEYRCSSCKAELAEGLGQCPACSGEVVPWRKVCSGCGVKVPPKYMHSKGFRRNLLLYGEHLANKGGTVYVVEGNPDVLAMWQVGIRPVVAMLGTGVRAGSVQVEKLVRWWDRIIVVGDGDQAGRALVKGTKAVVAGRVPVGSRVLPDGADPAGILSENPDKLGSLAS